MSRISACLTTAAALAAANGAGAQPAVPNSTALAPVVTAPPAPAFKVGAVVTDRTGVRLGPIQSITESPRGLVVVIEIDGKLIGVPQSTLTLRDDGAVSSQTKAQIIAAAGAPP